MSAAKKLLPILKTTFTGWNRHEAPRLGAALAFYTILSLSPLLFSWWLLPDLSSVVQ